MRMRSWIVSARRCNGATLHPHLPRGVRAERADTAMSSMSDTLKGTSSHLERVRKRLTEILGPPCSIDHETALGRWVGRSVTMKDVFAALVGFDPNRLIRRE